MNADEIKKAYTEWYKKKTGRKVLKHDLPYMFTTAYTIGAESRQSEIDELRNQLNDMAIKYQGRINMQSEINELRQKVIAYESMELMPPLKKPCPEPHCHDGHYPYQCNEDGDVDWGRCETCQGEGEVWNYFTPDQFVAWKREHGQPDYEMLYSDFIWYRGVRNWESCDYALYRDFNNGQLCIVARPGQPKPDNNWRPDEKTNISN